MTARPPVRLAGAHGAVLGDESVGLARPVCSRWCCRSGEAGQGLGQLGVGECCRRRCRWAGR